MAAVVVGAVLVLASVLVSATNSTASGAGSEDVGVGSGINVVVVVVVAVVEVVVELADLVEAEGSDETATDVCATTSEESEGVSSTPEAG